MWTRNTFIGIAIGVVAAFVLLLAIVGIYAIVTTALGSSSQTTQEAQREEPETKEETKEKTKEEAKAKTAPERTTNNSSDTDISLSGPGDKATPPTYLTKGNLVIDLTHSPLADLPEDWEHYSQRNFTVRVKDSEGKIIPGGFIWEQGEYKGSRSITLPEDGTYNIEVEGQSPWTLAATHHPT